MVREIFVLPMILYKYRIINTSGQSGQQRSVVFPQIWLPSRCSVAADKRLAGTMRPLSSYLHVFCHKSLLGNSFGLIAHN